MKDRDQIIALAIKLKALAEHPQTGEHEALSARKRLAQMIAEYEITEVELNPVTETELPPEFEQAMNQVYDQKNGSINFDAIDEMIGHIPDPKMRATWKAVSGVARLFQVWLNK